MRLYLSSFRLGDEPERMLSLMRRPGPVAVIPNAIDMCEPEVRAAGVQRELDDLGQLGLRAEVLDLREFRGQPTRLRSELETLELLWVRGGNVFVLREAFRFSGLDRLLPALLASDSFVYAGYSAGPCLLAPSLAGLEHCDPLAELSAAYGEVEPTFEGLGVLPVAFVPHVDSPGHPETDLLADVARRYAASGVPHLRLRDGEAVVLDGDPTRLALP